MFRKKGSKILKLLTVRNCFTLAMTNKLVVIINSLNTPKIKKILQYEMKFLVPNYSCLQNPWLGSYRPQIPVLSVLNGICWTPPAKKILGMPLLATKLHSTITTCRFATFNNYFKLKRVRVSLQCFNKNERSWMMKITVFWYVMLCSPMETIWCFRATYCLQLQDWRSLPDKLTSYPRRQ